MKNGRPILAKERFSLTIDRLCYQLIENFDTFENVCLVGIQPRGTYLADRLMERLIKLNKKQIPQYGKLDITFYRDDYRHKEKPLKPEITEMDFLVEGKEVILVDDVLYTGRTIHAAMTAIQDFGRPDTIDLMCLVDRRFNRHFPIEPDFTGITVDSLDEAYVKVEWGDEGNDQVLIFSDK
jgi:pyrimidine operon attenuation protein/uracil phosphoribosyltransferase